MRFKAEPFGEVPFRGSNVHISDVHWTFDALVIRVRSRSSDEEAVVRFSAEWAPNKFRLVDEADINDWEGICMSDSWLYTVESGGWFAHESEREGFLGRYGVFTEYLIVGTDECVSVITKSSPDVTLATETTSNCSPEEGNEAAATGAPNNTLETDV
jgi:hypothetical protein